MAKKQAESFEDFAARMNKKYGDGTLLVGTNHIPNVDSVPHVSLGFNKASVIWGIPRGRVVRIEGNQHTGKSTFVMETIAQYQKQGLRCWLFDYEHSFDRKYATKLGIDMDKLIIQQPTTMEEGYNILREGLEGGFVDLAIIDSITKMKPKAVIEGEIGDHTVGLAARLHDQALGIIQPLLTKRNATLIGITQYRDKIGGMNPSGAKGVSGGNTWLFDPSMVIKLSRLETEKKDGTFINFVEITKNKTGTPFLKYKMFYTTDSGVDRVAEMVEYGKELGIIKLAGSWYSHQDGTKLGQGLDSVKELMNDNPEMFEKIYQEVEQALREA